MEKKKTRWDNYEDFSDTGSMPGMSRGTSTTSADGLARQFEEEPSSYPRQDPRKQARTARGRERADGELRDNIEKEFQGRDMGSGRRVGGRRAVSPGQRQQAGYESTQSAADYVPRKGASVGGASNSIDWGSNAIKTFETSRAHNKERRAAGGGGQGLRSRERRERTPASPAPGFPVDDDDAGWVSREETEEGSAESNLGRRRRSPQRATEEARGSGGAWVDDDVFGDYNTADRSEVRSPEWS